MILTRVRPLLLVMIALAIVVESVYEYGVIKKSDDGPTAEQLLAALKDCNRVGGDYSPGGQQTSQYFHLQTEWSILLEGGHEN